MKTKKNRIRTLINKLMRERKITALQLANELRINSSTVSRWLSGKDLPSPKSCQKIAKLGNLKTEEVLTLAGYIKSPGEKSLLPSTWPAFSEYARGKYSDELGEDLIIMIEGIIERRKKQKHSKKHNDSIS